MRSQPDMATLWAAGLPLLKYLLPWPRSQRRATDRPRPRAGGNGSTRAEIDAFLAKVKDLAPSTKPGQRGRLIFALDATMSRQPMWDTACQLQADMFREAAAIGGLDVQLVYYRGLGECRASHWVSQAERLGALMERIDCRGGHTQIGKIIAHAKRETQITKVQALVFVGDAMEEKLDDLCHAAGELGLLGVPAFMFQEGDDPIAEQAFREIARLDARRLLPLRSGRGAPARRAVACGGRLCRGRNARARRSLGAARRPAPSSSSSR